MYSRTNWRDHVVDQSTGEVIQQGTPVSAGNMNKQENGIFGSTETATVILQQMRQNERLLDYNVPEVGTVTLTNNQAYPFNNSQQTVAIKKTRNTLDYDVTVDVTSLPNRRIVGDILIRDKQTNGFKIEYTGSAPSVTVKYFIRGGL